MSMDYSEKRDYYRIRMGADTPVDITVVETQETLLGRCHNLSAAGVLLKTARLFPVGTELDINITPEYAVVAPLNARIEVVRVENNDDGSYTLGGSIRTMR